MKSMLIAFLEKFPSITTEEVGLIAEKLNCREFKKGEVVEKEGRIPKYCYFVLSGCVRQYRLQDGLEKTLEFYTEANGVINSLSFVNQTPSNYTLVCMEDSLLLLGDPAKDMEMYQEFPVLKKVTDYMMEKEWVKEREKFASFISSSPEERYKNFIARRGDLLNRVPQHQIASYLGMKPESLSRIRKRISVST
jgi:CRP-like cAMP-binding protein